MGQILAISDARVTGWGTVLESDGGRKCYLRGWVLEMFCKGLLEWVVVGDKRWWEMLCEWWSSWERVNIIVCG